MQDSVEQSRELDEAIAAYVGFGTSRTPTADAGSLPADMLRQVDQCVTIADTVAFEDVAPFDSRLRDRLHARLRNLLPELGPAGIEALGWRWGYLQFR